MILENIFFLGRYKNKETGKEYNIRKGKEKHGVNDYYFYTFRGTRHIMTERNFYILFERAN